MIRIIRAFTAFRGFTITFCTFCAGFSLLVSAAAAPITFSNLNAIIINDSTNPPTTATPYPSTITVSGLSGQVVTSVTVQLKHLSHTFPDDVDIVLVGPEGQNAVVMSNVGGGHPGALNVDLTLDDAAVSPLPPFGPLVSGTFHPTKRLSSFDFAFPSPAPATPGNASFSVFSGSDPNGAWNLFIVDDTNPDSGSIAGGWSLTITTTPVLLSIAQAETNVMLSWTNALTGYTLQTTPSLAPPVVWTNAQPAPIIVSGQFTVTNAASGASRSYRLAK